MVKLKLEVGKTYKTFGGWKAAVIWECRYRVGVYAIHCPGNLAGNHPNHREEESVPIFHHPDGRAASGLSPNEPPVYGKHHPADLIEEVEEK